MSGNTVWSYVIGAVVGIAIAFFTAGTGLAAYSTFLGTMGFGIATAAASYYLNKPGGGAMSGGSALNKSGGGSVKNAAAQDLEIASASEAVTIPVVFGSCRLAGNVLRYDRSTFREEPIIERYKVTQPVINVTQSGGGGGKGGGGGGGGSTSGSGADEVEEQWVEQIVGYNYFLSIDFGLCMGKLDRIGKIWDGTDQRKVGNGIAFISDRQTVTLKGVDTGGTARFYRGSDTQTRLPGDHYSSADSNHRHVAFFHLQNFHIGTSPVPRTYLVEAIRWPVCLDDTGVAITGLITKGSLDPDHPQYLDANPAAILYECFTNDVWGRGLDPSEIDIPSFVAASQYFAQKNIGLSFSLETQDVLSGAVDMIRQHVNTIVFWSGQKLKIKVLMDTATSYGIAATFNSDSLKDLVMTRPSWPSCINEIKVEFTNRKNTYRPEIAIAQDLAGFSTVGTINSQKMTLSGFSSRELAEQQAWRILGELSFPRGSMTFTANRWRSTIEPGDLVKVVWTEFSDGPVTSFWRLVEIQDARREGIKVTLTEDLYATAFEGEEDTFTPPGLPYEDGTQNTDGDLYAGDDHTAPLDPGVIDPVQVFEMGYFLTGGDRNFIVTASKLSSFLNRLRVYWSLEASIDYQPHSNPQGWAVAGQLTSALPAGRQCIRRGSEGEFTLSLFTSANKADMLASANKVQLDSDNIQVLTAGGTDLLVVGREIIQCGHIQETSPGVFTVRNYIRGAYGSRVEAHASGAKFAFIPTWQRSAYVANMLSIPIGQPIALRAHTVTMQGEGEVDYDFTGPEVDHSFIGYGAMPREPGLLSASRVGDDWTVTLRPVFIDRGAAIKSDLQTDLDSLVTALPDTYGIYCEPYNGGSPTGPNGLASITFTPDDGSTAAAGVVVALFTAPPGTTALRVRQSIKSVQSYTYTEATA